ncbi:MAG: citrate synthase [Planctomycetota bacterium]
MDPDPTRNHAWQVAALRRRQPAGIQSPKSVLRAESTDVTVQDMELVPGLAGIPAAESCISFIDGQAGILEYRGHRIEVLGEKSSFEEIAWLLLHGSLPTQSELDGFSARLAEARKIPDALVNVIESFPADAHPMDALQAGLAVLGMVSPKVTKLTDPEQVDEAAIRLIAATGPIIAAFERRRRGESYIQPDPELSCAANFLYQLNGKKPSELEARVLDVALVLHADHTMNASTFAARVVASTEADPYTVASSAVGALTGPLHGGANERVLNQLESIGGVDKVEAWFDEMNASKKKIMGFGHRVYKTKDPRATALQGLVRDLFAAEGTTPIYDTALALEKCVVDKLGDRGIHPNVDFFSGIVYQKMGIPTDAFTPIFALSRIAGWMAHWKEQMKDNKLFRPGQIFTGSHDGVYTPIEER